MAIQGYSPGQAGGLGDTCGNRVEAAEVHLLNGRLVLFPQRPALCEGFLFSFLLRWPHSEAAFSLYRKEARSPLRRGALKNPDRPRSGMDADYRGGGGGGGVMSRSGDVRGFCS